MYKVGGVNRWLYMRDWHLIRERWLRSRYVVETDHQVSSDRHTVQLSHKQTDNESIGRFNYKLLWYATTCICIAD